MSEELHIGLINKKEYEKLFRSNYSELCAYANRFLNDLDASEDIVQEMFVKLWNNRESLEIHSSQRSYLFRAVRNGCLNVIKHIDIREEYKQDNERRMLVEESFSAEYELTSELEQKIRSAIDKLPIKRRKVFIMSRYEGLKYKEIAEKLSVSVKTVEKQMSSALKFMREELKEYLPLLLIYFADLFEQLMQK